MQAHQLGVLLLAGLALAPTAVAQEPEAVIFAAYWRCDQSREARTDTIHQNVAAPIWQKHVDAGRLTTFGWARHYAGGEWRRLGYIIGADLASVNEAGRRTSKRSPASIPKRRRS